MLRVYDSIQNDPEVLLLSHTIDPEYDTVGLLHDFANGLGVKSKNGILLRVIKKISIKLPRPVILQPQWKINRNLMALFTAALFSD